MGQNSTQTTKEKVGRVCYKNTLSRNNALFDIVAQRLYDHYQFFSIENSFLLLVTHVYILHIQTEEVH
jgi:hypothetical protein